MIPTADIPGRLMAAARDRQAEKIDFESTTGRGQWTTLQAYDTHMGALTNISLWRENDNELRATTRPGPYSHVASSILDGLVIGDQQTDDYLFVYGRIEQTSRHGWRLTWPEPTPELVADIPAKLAAIEGQARRTR